MKELIVISDNLALAAEALRTESNQGIFEGIELIHKQLCDVLSKSGVVSIKSVGKMFDPHLHEAVMSEDDDNLPDNVITEEIQKGYKLHDKVIRHSKVKVNKRTDRVDRWARQ
jgi:molecular chaperone GrpE